LSSGASTAGNAPVDEALVNGLFEWIQARSAVVDLELRQRAGRDGICDAIGSEALAEHIAATTALPFSGPDYLGFSNVATYGDDNNPLLDLPVGLPQEDGTELNARLGDVIAGIRRLQPHLFDLLVDLQRIRNVRLDEGGKDYIAYARSRIPGNDGLIRAVNVAVNERLVEHSFERYLLNDATGKLAIPSSA